MKFRDIIFEWLLIENKEEIYNKYYSDIDRGTFIRIIEADPQTSVVNNEIKVIGKYAKIFLQIYKEGNLKIEDLPKVNEYLGLVYRYKLGIDAKNVKSVGDLYEIVKGYIAKSEKSLASVLSILPKDEYDVLLNGESWYVFRPKTEKAAAYLGVNTEWCTTWGAYSLNPNYKDRTNHFSSYNQQGPLQIIINKENENDKYQLHIASNQLKNPADREINDRGKFFDDRLEVKKILFPYIYKADITADEANQVLTTVKKFLAKADYQNILNVIIDSIGIGNQFVDALKKYDIPYVERSITDESIGELQFSGENLSFVLKKLPFNLESHYNGVGYLERGIEDAYNYVHESEYESWRDEDWAYQTIGNYLEKYYESNKTSLKSDFGAATDTYEDFYNTFIKQLYENDMVRDGYLDAFVEGTGAALQEAYRKELSYNKEYVEIDYSWSNYEITFPVDQLIIHVAKNEITDIPNIDDFFEEYMRAHNLTDSDWFDMPEYEYSYPSQEKMDSVFDNFFERIVDQFEQHPECTEEQKKFQDIYVKYFKSKPVYENEFVKIKLFDTNFIHIDCSKGVRIEYFNKKNGERYDGYVKVANLINYMQIEPLFERLSLVKLSSNIL